MELVCAELHYLHVDKEWLSKYLIALHTHGFISFCTIYILQGKPRCCFYYHWAVYNVYIIGYIMAWSCINFLAHCIIFLSLLWRLMQKHWTYNARKVYPTGCVPLIKSRLPFVQCMGLCIFSLPITLLMIVMISILGHETMVCIYIYTYIYMCVCTCVCVWYIWGSTEHVCGKYVEGHLDENKPHWYQFISL